MRQTTKQLAADLEAFQKGNCWIDYNAMDVLATITPEIAAFKAYKTGNTIWQLVNHISYWRKIVARRLAGKDSVENESNGMDQPLILNGDSWRQTLLEFDGAFFVLHAAILALKEEDLSKTFGTNGTFYANITGSLQHDAYHTGQIVMLRQMALHLQK